MGGVKRINGAYGSNPLRVGDRSVSNVDITRKFNRMVVCREQLRQRVRKIEAVS